MITADIWNTPGYFYSISYILCLALICSVTVSGERMWETVSRHIVTALILFALMAVTDGADGLLFVVYMLSVVAVFYLRLYLRTGDWKAAIFWGTKAFMLGELTASVCWLGCFLLATGFPTAWNLFWQILVMGLIYAFCSLLILQAERQLIRPGLTLVLSPQQLASQVVVAFSVYLISNLGYVDRAGVLGLTHGRFIFLLRTVVDLAGVALLYAQHSQIIEAQQRNEKEALRRIMENQYQAYQLSRESMEMVNQKYHDLKHQIHLLRREAGSEKSQAYLRQMEEEIRDYEAQNKTGNPVLDAVLTQKSLQCRKQGIELRVIADGSLLRMMNEMEISALFGNMLDNAIESEEKAPPEKRIIRLYIDSEKGFARIRMENYTEESLRFSDGLPLTTKKDKNLHGFGMKSMRQTVEKYGGSLIALQQESWFQLRILIPLRSPGADPHP